MTKNEIKRKMNDSEKVFKPIFDFVTKDLTNWKDPIKTYVPYSVMRKNNWNFDNIADSIYFYTATYPEFYTDGYFLGTHVVADGYRMGPAGDK